MGIISNILDGSIFTTNTPPKLNVLFNVRYVDDVKQIHINVGNGMKVNALKREIRKVYDISEKRTCIDQVNGTYVSGSDNLYPLTKRYEQNTCLISITLPSP
jgi:hypothetical protein